MLWLILLTKEARKYTQRIYQLYSKDLQVLEVEIVFKYLFKKLNCTWRTLLLFILYVFIYRIKIVFFISLQAG